VIPFWGKLSSGSLLHITGTNPSPPRDVLLGGVFAVENVLILVIEDDLEIQAIIDEALCDGGYAPALAASGEEAMTLLKDGQTPYRVLVTDINLLGRVDGWEVAKQNNAEAICVRALHPDARHDGRCMSSPTFLWILNRIVRQTSA
jgi:hypothetical protein